MTDHKRRPCSAMEIALAEENNELKKRLSDVKHLISQVADDRQWWHGYHVDGAKYDPPVTIWRGNWEPDEIAQKAIDIIDGKESEVVND